MIRPRETKKGMDSSLSNDNIMGFNSSFTLRAFLSGFQPATLQISARQDENILHKIYFRGSISVNIRDEVPLQIDGYRLVGSLDELSVTSYSLLFLSMLSWYVCLSSATQVQTTTLETARGTQALIFIGHAIPRILYLLD